MPDPNRWQPLALAEQISQNELPIPGKDPDEHRPHWGKVTSFGLQPTSGVSRSTRGAAVVDDRRATGFKDEALEVIRRSGELDASDDATIDISPGAFGGNTLGANDGTGYPVNPVTGEPYAPNVVKRGDYARVLAEYWADGPKSETPPGHWNVIAN